MACGRKSFKLNMSYVFQKSFTCLSNVFDLVTSHREISWNEFCWDMTLNFLLNLLRQDISNTGMSSNMSQRSFHNQQKTGLWGSSKIINDNLGFCLLVETKLLTLYSLASACTFSTVFLIYSSAMTRRI